MNNAPAPLHATPRIIMPEWLSAGSPHLNVANYLMLFSDAAVELFATLGLNEAYQNTHGQLYLVAEAHLLYQRELRAGDVALISMTVLDASENRVHAAMEMHREGDPARSCLGEFMFVSVTLATSRPAPWAGAAAARIFATREAHAKLPPPEKLGRRIEIRRS